MKIFSILCASLLLSACACNCADKMTVNSTDLAMATGAGECITARIEGMVCESCAATVTANLQKQSGVESADVDVAKGIAHIHMKKGQHLATKTIEHIITRSDYVFKGITKGC